MTVASATNRVSYNGNGSTTIFAYTFKIFVDADLKVYVDDVLQTLTTDYTVSGAGNVGGGNVTFVTAPPTGTGNVVIFRELPLTQTLDLVENADEPSEQIEDELDKAVMRVQKLQETLDRTPKLAESSTETAPAFPEQVNDGIIKYKATASDGLEAVALSTLDPSLVTVSAYGETLIDDATAADARTTLGLGDAATKTVGSGNGLDADTVDGIEATAIPFFMPCKAVNFAGSPYTVIAGDQGKILNVDASGGLVVINLISAAAVANGFTIGIRNDSVINKVRVDVDGSDTISSIASSFTLEQDQILILSSSGATDWVVLEMPEQEFLIEDVKAKGTDGGGFTKDVWQKRDLQTIAHDDGNLVTSPIVSSEFVLQPGTYVIRVSAPAFRVDAHMIRLYDVTGTASLKEGVCSYSGFTGASQTNAELEHRFRIAAANTFRIEHQCTSTFASQGFGVPSNFTGVANSNERYTRVWGKRIDL